MKVYSLLDSFDIKEKINLCIGIFDGLHIGHMHLILEAKNEGVPVGVLTFDDSASSVFKNDDTSLTPFATKLKFLKFLGVKYVIYLPINEMTRSISREDFIDNYLKKIPIKSIYVGKDFRFGYKASGDIKTLKDYYKDKLHVIDMVDKDGVKISSRDIKNYLKEGNITEANNLLGHTYVIEGKVVKGLKNGRTIGFPTANIDPLNYTLPKNGVYVGLVSIDSIKYLAMINIGTHPTISPLNNSIIEAHIIGFDGDLYNQSLEIFFVDLLRPEKKFASLDELKSQLEEDKAKILQNYQFLLD